MRVVISGASGLIGTALRRRLSGSGHEVVRLVRRPPGQDEHRWDPATGELDPLALTGADAVVNLSGAGIGDKRWTEARKEEIYDSRILTTRLLVERMTALDTPPRVFISASAIGIYGDRGDEKLTEDSAPGPADDFLVHVTADWEDAARPAADAGIRTVLARSGIVLDRDEGALGRMLLPFKLGIGGKLGSGRQWWSWISIVDEVRAIEHLLASDLNGPVNLTAPHPVTNDEFTKALGDVLGRPTFMWVPRFALDVLLGSELAESSAFTSARVIPQKLLDDGFDFEHDVVKDGLEAALDQDS